MSVINNPVGAPDKINFAVSINHNTLKGFVIKAIIRSKFINLKFLII